METNDWTCVEDEGGVELEEVGEVTVKAEGEAGMVS